MPVLPYDIARMDLSKARGKRPTYVHNHHQSALSKPKLHQQATYRKGHSQWLPLCGQCRLTTQFLMGCDMDALDGDGREEVSEKGWEGMHYFGSGMDI